MPRATTSLSYLTLSLVILGSLVFTVFVTVPQWSGYQQARQDLERAREKREEQTQFLANIDARKKELEAYVEDVLALSVALPEDLRPADMLATLQAIAAGSGVMVFEVGEPKKVTETPVVAESQGQEKPSGSAAPAALERWDMLVKVRGTYPQIRSFVRDLEHAPLLSDIQFVDVIAMVAGGTETSGGILEAKVHVRTYVQITPK